MSGADAGPLLAAAARFESSDIALLTIVLLLIAFGAVLAIAETRSITRGAEHEHLALAVFRAVEHRVDLVRAVNTGVSVFIDATGRVYERGPVVDPSLVPPPGPP